MGLGREGGPSQMERGYGGTQKDGEIEQEEIETEEGSRKKRQKKQRERHRKTGKAKRDRGKENLRGIDRQRQK